MHGKTSPIEHDGRGVFAGLPSPFEATRYHSLLVERASLPSVLEVSAWTREEEIMGLREDPMLSNIFRWPAANPIYGIGHEARVRRIEGLLDPAWNLHLSGSGFRGVGIPDCVRAAMTNVTVKS